MGLFSAIVGVTVEVVKVPLKVAADVVMVPVDIQEPRGIGCRSREALESIKDEAAKADE